MKLYIILPIIAILACSVYSADTFIKDKVAYTADSQYYVGQYPDTIDSKTDTKLTFLTNNSDSYILCFEFPINSDNFELLSISKRKFMGLLSDNLNTVTKSKNTICVKDFQNDYQAEIDYKLRYNGYGIVKYNVTLIPSSYKKNPLGAKSDNKIIVLDPYIIGDMAQTKKLLIHLPFNNSLNDTSVDKNVTLYNYTQGTNNSCGDGLYCTIKNNTVNNTQIKYQQSEGWASNNINYWVEFFYTDGTSANSSADIVGLAWENMTFANPKPYNLVYRTTTWVHPVGSSMYAAERASILKYNETAKIFYHMNGTAGYYFQREDAQNVYNQTPDGTLMNWANYTSEGLYLNSSNLQYVRISQFDGFFNGSTSQAYMIKFKPTNMNYAVGKGLIGSLNTMYDTLFLTTAAQIAMAVGTASGNVQVTATTPITVGNWYTAVGSYNGTHILLCVNGVCKTGAQTGGVTANTDPFFIGAGGTPSAGYYFNGTVQKAAVYNQSLNYDEAYRMSIDGYYVNNPVSESNQSLYLNSSRQEYLEIHNNTLLSTGSSPGTLAFWMKPSTVTGTRTIFSMGNLESGYWRIYQDGAILTLVDTTATLRSNTLAADTWKHIAYTWGNSNQKLYIDGELVNSSATGVNHYNNQVVFGRMLNNTAGIPPQYYDGTLDEILIYNYALSDSEVSNIYGGYNSSINITFLDEDSNNPVYNVSMDVISDSFSKAYSTGNGALFVSNIPDEIVTLRYRSDDYYERFYFLNMTPNTHLELTLYLINTSIASNITATVYDNANYLLSDAYIRYLRYDIDTNSYNIVGMAKSGINGQAQLYMVKGDEYYKFMLYYPFNTLKYESTPDYVYADSINFQLNILANYLENFDSTNNIDHNLTFNNATNSFRFTYSDANAIMQSAKLQVYQISASGRTLLNETTTTGASGTLLASIVPQNDTRYVAYGMIVFDDADEELIESYDYMQITQNPFGNFGLWLVWTLTIVFAFMGYFSIILAMILVPLPVILAASVGIMPMSFIGVGITIMIGSLILAFMIGNKG